MERDTRTIGWTREMPIVLNGLTEINKWNRVLLASFSLMQLTFLLLILGNSLVKSVSVPALSSQEIP